MKSKLHKVNGTLFLFNSGIGFYSPSFSSALKIMESWNHIFQIEHNPEKMKITLILTGSKKKVIFIFSFHEECFFHSKIWN